MYSVSMIVFAAALGLAAPLHAKISPAEVGAVVPDFSLKDIHRRPRSLAGFQDKKAFVILFIDTECPVAALYVPTLVELHTTYAAKGVQFVAIDSSAQDSFVGVSAFAQEREIPFPVLKDFDQSVADAFGALRTPEAFVLDHGRVMRYHGRIDDQYAVGVSRGRPTSRDLARCPRRTAGRQADHYGAHRGFGLHDRTFGKARPTGPT